MNELLKLSIEDLENILAIAPYSEMHQMAYSIKKRNHSVGSMYSVGPGSYHALHLVQEGISQKLIDNKKKIKLIADPDSNKESQVAEIKHTVEDKQDLSSEKAPKKKKKKKKKSEPKEIGKDQKDKSKKKKKKKKSSSKSEGKKKLKKEKEDDAIGLSDFSSWLLAHSETSAITALTSSTAKAKKKKKKKSTEISKNESLVSEPLAALLASQGHNEQAIEMYKKLSLIIPEKSAFFAAEIEKIQKEE
jgi:hypothetical protein